MRDWAHSGSEYDVLMAEIVRAGPETGKPKRVEPCRAWRPWPDRVGPRNQGPCRDLMGWMPGHQIAIKLASRVLELSHTANHNTLPEPSDFRTSDFRHTVR